MKRIYLLFLLSFCIQISFGQDVIYVDQSNTGTQDGTTWSTAFVDIQDAMEASGQNDSIFVATGTYYPSYLANVNLPDRYKTFVIFSNRHVFGGFAGTEASLAQRANDSTSLHVTNQTIISGDIGVSGDSTDNSYHVVTMRQSTQLNGFTIRDGNADGTDSIATSGGMSYIQDNLGGGIFMVGTNIAMRRLVVRNNTAARGGGGLHVKFGQGTVLASTFKENRVRWNVAQDGLSGGGGAHIVSAALTFEDCWFKDNSQHGAQGGGAARHMLNANVLYDHCSFMSNRSMGNGTDGGAAVYNASGSDVTATQCRFIENFTDNQGGASYSDNSIIEIVHSDIIGNVGEGGAGAMENDAQSNAILTDVLFEDNSTLNDGGAIQNWKSSPIINDCRFIDNHAGNDGGALFNYNECSPSVSNSIFSGNSADRHGGAIYNRRNCHPILTNLLVYDNFAAELGGGVYTQMSNSEPCDPIATNLTFTLNEAGISGGGVYDDGLGDSKLRNSIVNNNTAPSNPEVDVPASLAVTALSRSIVGPEYFETGSATPITWGGQLFMSIPGYDFRLAPNSFAEDIGDSVFFNPGETPDLSAIDHDVDGKDRVMGTNIDLGAFESCGDTAVTSAQISVSPSDTADSGNVVTFTSSWSNTGSLQSFEWRLNGTALQVQDSNQLMLTAGVDIDSGDVVSFWYEASAFCVAPDTGTSNGITIQVRYPVDTADTTPEDSTTGTSQGANRTMRVYPNPASSGNQLTLEFSQVYLDATIEVLDLRGRNVLQMKAPSRKTISISVEDLEQGHYLIYVHSPSAPPLWHRLILSD